MTCPCGVCEERFIGCHAECEVYKAWQERQKERPAAPLEHADVEIMYYFPTRSRHDADNYAGKFLLDGLTKAGVIVDDDMAHIRLHVAGGYDKRQPRTVITVREAEA